MKKWVVAGGIIVAHALSSSPVTAQATSATERDLMRRMQDVRALEGYARRKSEKDAKEAAEILQPPELSKKAKDRIRQLRIPSGADFEQYHKFLEQKQTGIIKIFPSYDCLSKNVIRLDGDCTKFVPDSSDFSFREMSYVHPLYHDVGFARGELISDAFFAQGIIASLGDIPIADVTIDTPGVDFLASYQTDTTFEAARKTAKTFRTGMGGNFRYSSHVDALPNTTYAFRIIAYDLANSLPPLSEERTLPELKFLSLSQDKREDLTAVFRIIRIDDLGGLTIVWKELRRVPAPKLRFGKGQALTDFK